MNFGQFANASAISISSPSSFAMTVPLSRTRVRLSKSIATNPIRAP
jgi:hypothetical protein